MTVNVGLCQCGCGMTTNIAKKTYTSDGVRKGQPRRYVSGHNGRKDQKDPRAYLMTHQPGHHRASPHGGVPTHVLIVERAMGKPLPVGAEVHHVDRNRHNNTPRNLVVCQDRVYHRLLHVRARILKAGGNPNTDKVCSRCHTPKPYADFNRSTADMATGRYNYCRPCTIDWSRGRPPKVRPASK